MKSLVTSSTRNFKVLAWLSPLAIATGIALALSPGAAFGTAFALVAFGVVAIPKNSWANAFWVSLFGLVVWSYGFNNVPLVRPVPLVDALAFFAVTFSFRRWWAWRKHPVVRKLLFFLCALLLVVILRLVFDIPQFGPLAVRDGLFAFELWVLLPAIALGFMYGESKTDRCWTWLFMVSTAWLVLYPWRDLVAIISPVFGLQRPVPLFAFTNASFMSVPAFFWFLHRRNAIGAVGLVATLVILLVVQSRGAYLAFFLASVALWLLQPRVLRRWGRLLMATLATGTVLWLVGSSLTGRLGESVGFDTIVAQLQTLTGEEGPGAGSFRHRVEIMWPHVINLILSDPLRPIFGLGLGPDLVQGFEAAPGALVRKPHNDFLEIWARLGIVGLLPWLGILAVVGREAVKGARRDARHGWVLALQITLWIHSLGQPAMGFAYVTVVWAGLTGLWLGTQLRERP